MSDTKSKALEALSNELREVLQSIPAGEAIRKLVLIMLAEVDEAAEKRGRVAAYKEAARRVRDEFTTELKRIEFSDSEELSDFGAGFNNACIQIYTDLRKQSDRIEAEIQAAERGEK